MLSDDPNKDDLCLLRAREVEAHACRHRRAHKPNDSGQLGVLIKTHFKNACLRCCTLFTQNMPYTLALVFSLNMFGQDLSLHRDI